MAINDFLFNSVEGVPKIFPSFVLFSVFRVSFVYLGNKKLNRVWKFWILWDGK